MKENDFFAKAEISDIFLLIGFQVFLFKVLSVIYFMSFFISMFFYLGWMQWVVIQLGWLLQVLLTVYIDNMKKYKEL